MKKLRFLPFIFAIFILILSIAFVSQKQGNTATKKSSATSNETSDYYMKGLWVSYITLDVESEDNKKEAFYQKIDDIIKDMKKANLNTMIVQVRPFCDAIYKSDYFPYSHIISGVQGKNPGFDPLSYICTACHKENIYVHAWLNPYRVQTKETPKKLCEDNPYMKDKSIGVELESGIYLNPANQKSQELITNGVREIVENYDIDGIQFDDYFYPPDSKDFDKEDYKTFTNQNNSKITLKEFRMNNVNNLIKNVYTTVHNTKENVVFGISPQGNIDNNINISADVISWCEETGYIDYICPQIYFSLDNPKLTFEDSLKSWIETKKHDNLQLYIGLAAYKGGTDSDSGTWLDNNDILKTEIEILSEKQCDGFMLYSYESFHNQENAEEIQNVINYLSSSPSQ